MASSSSMTRTTALAVGIADTLLRHGRQRGTEDGAAAGVWFHVDLPAVGLDDGARDRQADAHAVALVGDERLEQLRRHFRCDPGAAVGDADSDHAVLSRRG